MYSMREVKAYEMKLELAMTHLSLSSFYEGGGEREMGYWKILETWRAVCEISQFVANVARSRWRVPTMVLH